MSNEIVRTYDPTYLSKASERYSHTLVGLEPDKLVPDFFNICLVNTLGDVTLFEYCSPGVYEGHYFLVSRGVKAYNVCKDMLEEVFRPIYGVDVIEGMTPLDNRGALRMNERLGFIPQYIVERETGPDVYVLLTKQRYNELNEETKSG